MPTEALKQTPLAGEHRALGARMVPFGGWEMPVQYTGILDEHRAVRERAGLFDLSHMGEIVVKGRDALSFLQFALTADLADLEAGGAKYTLMCRGDGGVLDDLVVYHRREEWLLVVNAATTERDADWLHTQAARFGSGTADLTLVDRSREVGLLALQGPLSQGIMGRVVEREADLDSLPSFHFLEASVGDVPTLLSRTGYTGEDGFEVYCDAGRASEVWRALIKAGESDRLQPCGLGARDGLRLEARLPLYGHELSESINPVEAGLKFAVGWEKEDFIGRDALVEIREAGPRRRLVGFVMEGRGVPRAGYPISKDGTPVGEVTSGGTSPVLGKQIGMGFVQSEHRKAGTEISVEIRGRTVDARIVKGRFIQAGCSTFH